MTMTCFHDFQIDFVLYWYCNLFVFRHYKWEMFEIRSNYSPDFNMKMYQNTTVTLILQ